MALVLACAVTVFAADQRLALVSAVDQEGTPLVAIDAADYIVKEGATACDVTRVTPAAYPVAVIVDTSSFARDGMEAMRSAVLRLVATLSGRDVVFYTGGTPARRVVDFTQDLSRIEDAVSHAFAEPNAAPRRFDALIDTARHLRSRHALLTRIILVSAGGPDASARSAADVWNAVLASRSIVDVVDLRQNAGIDRGMAGSSYNPRAPMPRVRNDSDADVLEAVSRRTLGTYERIVTPEGFGSALTRMRNRVMSEAIIEYEAPPGAPHDLQVGLRLPIVTVRGIALERSP